MKGIILANNRGIAFVDDEDYEMLSKFKWRLSHGYALRSVKVNEKRTSGFMHQMLIDIPKGFVTDHKDGNKLNNMKENLRIATRSQNQHNRKKNKKGCSSKFKGVCWHKLNKKWYVSIRLNYKLIHIGYFTDEIKAAKAYNDKAIKLFREFAKINHTTCDF